MSSKYCIKCKAATPVVEGSSTIVASKRGHPLEQTLCGTCGSKVSRYVKHDPENRPTILPKAVHDQDAEPKTPKTPTVKKSRSTKKEKAQSALNAQGVAGSPVEAKE